MSRKKHQGYCSGRHRREQQRHTARNRRLRNRSVPNFDQELPVHPTISNGVNLDIVDPQVAGSSCGHLDLGAPQIPGPSRNDGTPPQTPMEVDANPDGSGSEDFSSTSSANDEEYVLQGRLPERERERERETSSSKKTWNS